MRQSTGSQRSASCAAHRIHRPSKLGQASVSFPRLGGGLRDGDRMHCKILPEQHDSKKCLNHALCAERDQSAPARKCETFAAPVSHYVLTRMGDPDMDYTLTAIGGMKGEMRMQGIRAMVRYCVPTDSAPRLYHPYDELSSSLASHNLLLSATVVHEDAVEYENLLCGGLQFLFVVWMAVPCEFIRVPNDPLLFQPLK